MALCHCTCAPRASRVPLRRLSSVRAVIRRAVVESSNGKDEENLFVARAVLQTLAAAPLGGDAEAATARKQKV